MEIKSLPEALKTIMRQHGWTQRELGRQLGMSQVWVSQVTRGQKDTGVANMIRRLSRIGWELVIRPKREDPVKRRQFLAAATSVAFVPSAQTPPYQDPEYVRALTDHLSTSLYEQGGLRVLPAALEYAQQMKGALTSTDRTLQAAASSLTAWAAWVAKDSERFDIGERLGRLALALANRAGDQEAQSGAYSALSRISIGAGRPHDAVAYARRGVALPEITPAQRAWLNMRLGRALALVGGQDYAAREALAQAQDTTAYLPDVFEVADLTGNIGEGLSDLRAYSEAQASLDESAALSEKRSPLLHGSALVLQAKTALRASDPEFAVDRMVVLARITPMVSSSWLRRNAREILDLSARWATVPEMHTAREYLSSVLPANRT